MATTRNQGATDQTQDAKSTQANNHAQTPDQDAANSGAYAQSSYQNIQSQPTAGRSEGQDAEATSSGDNTILDTAVEAGKKWLDHSGVLNSANQVPQAVKQWGNKAISSVNGLSTTQKVVGGALLLAGVAFLSSRGRGKSSYSSADEDDTNYRSGGKSNYRQGSWAGYSGGKSASSRNAQGGSGISSYGTERRATGGSGYGRSTGSTDTEFGSGRSTGSTRGVDSSSNYSAGNSASPSAASSANRGGSYSSGSTYNSGNSDSSSLSSGRSYGSAANSNEEDYDNSL